MSVFVDRQQVFESFNAVCQRNSPHWLLLLDGVEGIGKTAVLHQLIAKQSPTNRLIHLDFSSPIYNSDPLALMNRLASELPVAPFQQFTADLLKAYDGLQSAHIKTENKIVVDRGAVFTGDVVQTASGPYQVQDSEADKALKRLFVECKISLDVSGIVSNNQIVQIASVDLGQALRDLKRLLRDELTTRFAQIVEAYLQSRPNEQIFLFVDNVDQVQKKPTGDEYLAWFLNSLLGVIHRRFSTRLRAVLSNSSAADWPEIFLKQAKQISLETLALEDAMQYLQQRNVYKEQIAKGIFELTQGHPLCLVMATDLYGLAPNLGVRELQRYATDPFDSRKLVFNLFQAILLHMPDEEMKRLLRYGPIFRVLDDEIINNVLAVELGIAKDRLKELLDRLRDYAILEDVEEFVFRPIIQQQILADFRQNAANDPVYRKLNRRAYEWYGQQWQQAKGQRKNLLRLRMVMHEVNLVPQKVETIIKQQIEQAFQQNEPELAYDLIEWVQTDQSFPITQTEIKRWEKQAPDEIYLRVESVSSPVKGNQNEDDFLGWLRLFFIGSRDLVWGFTKRRYISVRNYITSPLRTLESHLRRSNKLIKLQRQLYKNLTNKQIPRIQKIQSQAQELQQSILTQGIPGANNCKATNAQLVEQIQLALRQQQLYGYVSSIQFNTISHQLDQQNKIIGSYNKQIQNLSN